MFPINLLVWPLNRANETSPAEDVGKSKQSREMPAVTSKVKPEMALCSALKCELVNVQNARDLSFVVS